MSKTDDRLAAVAKRREELEAQRQAQLQERERERQAAMQRAAEAREAQLKEESERLGERTSSRLSAAGSRVVAGQERREAENKARRGRSEERGTSATSARSSSLEDRARNASRLDVEKSTEQRQKDGDEKMTEAKHVDYIRSIFGNSSPSASRRGSASSDSRVELRGRNRERPGLTRSRSLPTRFGVDEGRAGFSAGQVRSRRRNLESTRIPGDVPPASSPLAGTILSQAALTAISGTRKKEGRSSVSTTSTTSTAMTDPVDLEEAERLVATQVDVDEMSVAATASATSPSVPVLGEDDGPGDLGAVTAILSVEAEEEVENAATPSSAALDVDLAEEVEVVVPSAAAQVDADLDLNSATATLSVEAEEELETASTVSSAALDDAIETEVAVPSVAATTAQTTEASSPSVALEEDAKNAAAATSVAAQVDAGGVSNSGDEIEVDSATPPVASAVSVDGASISAPTVTASAPVVDEADISQGAVASPTAMTAAIGAAASEMAEELDDAHGGLGSSSIAMAGGLVPSSPALGASSPAVTETEIEEDALGVEPLFADIMTEEQRDTAFEAAEAGAQVEIERGENTKEAYASIKSVIDNPAIPFGAKSTRIEAASKTSGDQFLQGFATAARAACDFDGEGEEVEGRGEVLDILRDGFAFLGGGDRDPDRNVGDAIRAFAAIQESEEISPNLKAKMAEVGQSFFKGLMMDGQEEEAELEKKEGEQAGAGIGSGAASNPALASAQAAPGKSGPDRTHGSDLDLKEILIFSAKASAAIAMAAVIPGGIVLAAAFLYFTRKKDNDFTSYKDTSLESQEDLDKKHGDAVEDFDARYAAKHVDRLKAQEAAKSLTASGAARDAGGDPSSPALSSSAKRTDGSQPATAPSATAPTIDDAIVAPPVASAPAVDASSVAPVVTSAPVVDAPSVAPVVADSPSVDAPNVDGASVAASNPVVDAPSHEASRVSPAISMDANVVDAISAARAAVQGAQDSGSNRAATGDSPDVPDTAARTGGAVR